MKLLFVLDYYFPYMGGSEILFKTLAEGMVKKGHDVSVLTMLNSDAKPTETLNGVKIRRLRSTNHIFPRFVFMLQAFFWLLFHGKQYDLLHTTSCGSSISTWLVSKLRTIPAVITVHEVIGKNWKSLYQKNSLVALGYRILERIMVTLPYDKHICVSHSTRKGLLKYGVKRKGTAVVHNALDYAHWNPKKYTIAVRKNLGLKKQDFVYLFYGRPGVSKGVEYLIKAIPEILEKIPQSKAVLLMGTEPRDQYDKMKRLLEKYGNGSVILHKPVPYKQLPGYIKSCDCVVVPSITEGFGYCVAESCAMGKPVVASNTTSIPEVVSGKFIIIPPKQPHAIADALLKIKHKKYMKTPLKKFTKDHMITDYEALYEMHDN
jgi:D-inositol-3-phosphate glycosyltransferase